ncbi:hypothetical protein TNCT_93141 [Trichonephila clavata]|uniref:Triple QxxK/R motif-containing protein n=1 Tax=Trichonephila clavata TaxID=2740835 RepID=A0A8X6HY68_TRICU|nr:hypothetical protein TNCT_93141 [Trichonephila clavata]
MTTDLHKNIDMGKNKDSTKVVPIQNYRKQIGKQDYKKSKTELKEVKARSLAKKCSGSVYKEITFMIFVFTLILGYCIPCKQRRLL